MECRDCDAESGRFVRCADCRAEVDETPDWQPSPVRIREPSVRTCERCLGSYTSKRRGQRFCSIACAARRYGPVCSTTGCDRPHVAKGLCGSHYNRTYFPDSRQRWPEDPEKRRVRLRARTQRRRAASRGANAEKFEDVEIFERDGWRCQIKACGKRVDKRLSWPHPMSASLDHVIPLTETGTSHTRANVRLAHLKCNVSRSNHGGNEQLALIG